MIISASRRTDIPAFYSPWLMGRIEAGFVKTKNPLNPAQVREVSLRPEDVDCFVFWSKDPAPMLHRLDTLDALGYAYYFQFTLTPYGPDLERCLPPKTALVKTFQELSRRLGRHRVIWRYDPVIINDAWSVRRHITAFEQLCGGVGPYTEGVIFSFVDLYRKVQGVDVLRAIQPGEMHELAAGFGAVANAHGLTLCTCCEAEDFSAYGVGRSACIDRALVERISGKPVSARADPGQRPGCGCCRSVDIGAYNTCGNGCVYCYANHSPATTRKNRLRHDPQGESLIP